MRAEQQAAIRPAPVAVAEPRPSPSILAEHRPDALQSGAATASRADASGSALASPLSVNAAGACHQYNFAIAAAQVPQAQGADQEVHAECVVCWEAPANGVLQPCGHMCVCSGCIGLLSGLPCHGIHVPHRGGV